MFLFWCKGNIITFSTAEWRVALLYIHCKKHDPSKKSLQIHKYCADSIIQEILNSINYINFLFVFSFRMFNLKWAALRIMYF